MRLIVWRRIGRNALLGMVYDKGVGCTYGMDMAFGSHDGFEMIPPRYLVGYDFDGVRGWEKGERWFSLRPLPIMGHAVR